MKNLEGHINGLERILGNSDRLRPGRERREEATLPDRLNNFRTQATNLHKAIYRSLRCTCLASHSSQLLWRSNALQNSLIDQYLMLEVYFPRKSRKWSQSPIVMQPEDDWYASNIEMKALPICHSYMPAIPDGATEIRDLCAALDIADDSAPCLGYLLDEDRNRLIVHRSRHDDVSPSSVQRVVKLRELIQASRGNDSNTATESRLPKVTRLSIAIKLVEAVLQLFDTPWLQDNWGKDDIHFFEDRSGSIYYDMPFLVSDFDPSKTTRRFASRRRSVNSLPSSVQEMHTY